MLWHLLSDLIPGDADRDCNNYFMSCAHVHFVKMVYFIVKLFVHFVGDYSEMHVITHMLQIPVYYCQQFMCIRCLCSCMCCTETALTLCCCTVITSLLVVNGSLVCWFCLVLFQWFFLPGRMWTQCVWPSLRTLDVILSTWSLHYLLSSAILPSRCSATWNAWLASSLKPSGNCVLKRCRRFVLSLFPPAMSAGVIKRFLSSDDYCCCSLDRKTHKTPFSRPPQLTSHSFYLIYWRSLHCRNAEHCM